MRAIDGDALQKQLTKKKPGPANARYTEGFNDALLRFKSMIHSAHTIEPERKKGEWIIKDNPGTGWYRITCSECGEDVTSTAPCIGFYPNAKVMWDFCPNCGAEMREPEDIPMEYFESGGR